ncbi:UDP-3-O-(3-hydroxymyristoyl)glucosamine N-acyltransferase [bacterium]|nr:UDP-3-O-(3-hydroxymyristoyl)glucosamine N-acyltransferase [bacterium]
MNTTVGELAALINAKFAGDASLEITGVAKIEEATGDQITFVANPKYRKHLSTTKAGAVILDEQPDGIEGTYLITNQPYQAFLAILNYFHPPRKRPEAGIHESAVISPTAKIASEVSIGANCVVGDDVIIGSGCILDQNCSIYSGVSIGKDCHLYSNVSIREDCILGDRVIIQNGAVIGSDGFGFAPGEEAYAKIPQVGIVVVEDDVEIGANTTVDRATLGETRVCRGSKLDNLIQIAHNVTVGENTVMAAQVGIAGSTSIGKQSMFGGQVGVAGHLRLSDRIMYAAQSGVPSDPGENSIVGGTPARDIRLWRRIEASLSNLPELFKRVRKLEKALDNRE